MIHFGIDPDKVNTWLLNIVLACFALVEIALVAYIVSLTAYEFGLAR